MPAADMPPLAPASVTLGSGTDLNDSPVVVMTLSFAGAGPVRGDDGLWRAAVVFTPAEARRVMAEMYRLTHLAETQA